MAKNKGYTMDNLLKGAMSQKEREEGIVIKKESDLRNDIIIKPELKKLIPPLSIDEQAKLKDSIKKEGCRDPLVLWEQNNGEYILIDGHNRYQICMDLNIEFKVVVQNFDSIDAVKDWMIDNQLGKRNVTNETKSYLRGMQYAREKRKSGSKSEDGTTADRLALIHKVNEKTIKRDEKYAIALQKMTGDNEILRWKILNRDITVPKTNLMDLADEEETILRKVGEKLALTEDWNKAIKELTPPKEPIILSKVEKNIQTLKKNVIKEINKAIEEKNIDNLTEAERLIALLKIEMSYTKENG
jgi:ParB-like chromosome segregation protein Spo0J